MLLDNQDLASYPTKAGWDKYLFPGLSANLHMVKAVLLEPQPRGLPWASRYDGTIRRVW